MIFGKGKFSWSTALAELLIIALGVLAALGANAWNDRRLAHLEEADYLSRIVSELLDAETNDSISERVNQHLKGLLCYTPWPTLSANVAA